MLADVIRRVFKVELFYKQQQAAFEKEVTRVGAAKYRLDHKEEVSEVLDDLQQQVNARAVTALETLLSAFVADVLPELQREIKAEVGISRGVPSLKFMVVDENGNKESIIDGNGGSVTNIVCAGLRMIALVKSHARPFMVLDEGDCWLKPERVDAFYQVLFRVARELGVQLVVISHHDFSMLRHLGAFDIEFRALGEGVGVRYTPFEAEPSPHIRRIRLENYRSHTLTDIPLHPAITVIHGDNAIGKSAVVDALRAVCYGEAAEDSIRHDCDSCTVEIETAEGILSWTRQRKGSPREMFEISKDGAVVHRGPGVRAGVPEFVSNFLRIEKKDDLDIHLTHQKAPVFLLNLPASQQASILSVGAEAGYVPRMIEAHKEMCRKDREVVKNGEAFLARTEREVLEPLAWAEKADDLEVRLKGMEERVTSTGSAVAEVEKMVELGERLQAFLDRVPAIPIPELPRIQNTEFLEQTVSEMSALTATVTATPVPALAEPRLPWPNLDDCDRIAAEWAAAERAAVVTPLTVPAQPTIHDIDRCEQVLADMQEQDRIRRAAAPTVPDLPKLGDEDALVEFGKSWVAIHQVMTKLAPMVAPEVPALIDVAPALEMLQVAATEAQGLAHKEKELAALLQELDRAERDKEAILAKTGGACPVCNSLLKEHRKCA